MLQLWLLYPRNVDLGFKKKKKKHFSNVKLDTSNPLMHIGLRIDDYGNGFMVSMPYYETQLVECCGNNPSTVMCPNDTNLFDSAKDELLDKNMIAIFHTIVAKLLYLAKRTRPDILTVIRVLWKSK